MTVPNPIARCCTNWPPSLIMVAYMRGWPKIGIMISMWITVWFWTNWALDGIFIICTLKNCYVGAQTTILDPVAVIFAVFDTIAPFPLRKPKTNSWLRSEKILIFNKYGLTRARMCCERSCERRMNPSMAQLNSTSPDNTREFWFLFLSPSIKTLRCCETFVTRIISIVGSFITFCSVPPITIFLVRAVQAIVPGITSEALHILLASPPSPAASRDKSHRLV